MLQFFIPSFLYSRMLYLVIITSSSVISCWCVWYVMPRPKKKIDSFTLPLPRNDRNGVRILATRAGCRLRENGGVITIMGTARQIAQFVCWCQVYSLSFASYVLRPAAGPGLFSLRVTV